MGRSLSREDAQTRRPHCTPSRKAPKITDHHLTQERRTSPAATVHGLVRRQAELCPDATALRWVSGELSYRELDQAAEVLAAELNGASRVALFNDRSPELMVAIVAALKSGAAYVPLDTTYPQARLEYMIENSGADVLLCRSELTEKFPIPPGCRIVTIDGIHTAGVEAPATPLADLPASSASAAYISYTSGSTGKPKGVAIPHHGIATPLGFPVEPEV